MRAILFAVLMICVPASYARYNQDDTVCYHKPGYYFLYLNGYYYPDYQEPKFGQIKSSDCRCCHCNQKPRCGCNPTFSSGKHYYRVTNDEGLSVEYYIR